MPSLCHMLLGMFWRWRKFGRSKNIQAFFSFVSGSPRVFYVICLSTCLIFSFVLKWMNGTVEQNLKEAKLCVCDRHPKQVILLNYVSNQWYSFLLNWGKITLIFFLLLDLLHYDRKCIFWYSFNNIHVINYRSMILVSPEKGYGICSRAKQNTFRAVLTTCFCTGKSNIFFFFSTTNVLIFVGFTCVLFK